MTEIENFDTITDELEAMSDTQFQILSDKVVAMTPWQSQTTKVDVRDEDGFLVTPRGEDFQYTNFHRMQRECWNKFNNNPFVFTTILDTTGRLTGRGFAQNSTAPKINDFIKTIWEDPRNDLTTNFSKYVARSAIQGELHLVFTAHTNGFVEVDFLSPSCIKGFQDNSGILTPDNKPTFPLVYRVETTDSLGVLNTKFIPSINMAYYPELWQTVWKHQEWKMAGGRRDDISGKSTSAKFRSIGGYRQFVVRFDQGFVTKRNIGSLKVAIEWLEHYSNIKKWELDHKKSSGAYLWAIEIADKSALRTWLAMSDDAKKKTGLLAQKTPGGTLMLPPGFKINCHNPKLSSITNQDDDILRMVSAGLNTTDDQMTGSSSGSTYGGVKMSRGPITDRINDRTVDLERFLKQHFWRAAIFLSSKVSSLKSTVTEYQAYKFDNNEPQFKNVTVPARDTIQINFPVSEMGDIESKAKALLGVKHGSLNTTLGISNTKVANNMGIQNYHQERLRKATEDKMYPELAAEVDAEETGAIGETDEQTKTTITDKKDTETSK